MQKSILVTMLITSILFSQVSLAWAVAISPESSLDTENMIQERNMSEVIQGIAKQDPAQFLPNSINTTSEWVFTSEQKSYNIHMDINPSQKNVIFTKNNISIGISMPDQKSATMMKNHDGQVVSKENYYDVVIQSIDGGMRYVLNINSHKADKSYDFKMTLPTGYRLTQDKNGNVAILDAWGKTHADIAKPWAKDANGKEIKTWYIIQGSMLTQYVDFDKNSTFPIVADPTWCLQFISSTSWLYRAWTHPWSLSIIPTACGRGSLITGGGFYVNQSWNEVLNLTPVSIYWDKAYGNSTYWSMYNQYACHANFVFFKSNWNLEPTRPDVGYLTTVAAGCNP